MVVFYIKYFYVEIRVFDQVLGKPNKKTMCDRVLVLLYSSFVI